MNKVEHIVEIRGSASFGAEIRPDAAGYVLVRIPELVRDSIRMGVLRSSRCVGRPLKELSPAWEEIHFKGQSAGPNNTTQLHFTAPRLHDAASPLFEQTGMFDQGVDPEDTGFDLVGRMLADVANRRVDSERFDTPILQRLSKFAALLERGIDSLHLAGHRLEEIQSADINMEVITSAEEMYLETPASHRARVSGVLDMIRVSDRLFELLLPDNQRICVIWTASSVVPLRDFLSKPVVIEGIAVYRPSGSLLRIDAEAILPATEHDNFFATLPKPMSRKLDVKSLRSVQTAETGINRIWGAWDGDETDEEILAALEEMR